MLAKELFTGLNHLVDKDQPFGIDTICGLDIPSDRYIMIEGEFPDCNCHDCRHEVEKDLKRSNPILKKRRKQSLFNI